MSMHMAPALDNASDFRLLTDTEVDAVSGGLFFLALGFAFGFAVGAGIGVAIALW